MKRALLAGAIAIILSPVGHAQQPTRLSLSMLMAMLEKQSHTNEGRIFDQVAGAGRGFGWVNEHLKQTKTQPLYCPPGQLALVGKNFADITVQEYKRNAVVYDQIAGPDFSPYDIAVFILLQGLRQTFPCK